MGISYPIYLHAVGQGFESLVAHLKWLKKPVHSKEKKCYGWAFWHLRTTAWSETGEKQPFFELLSDTRSLPRRARPVKAGSLSGCLDGSSA